MNRNIAKIAGIIFGAFLIVIIYQTYLQVFQGEFLLYHPRNRRLMLLEEAVSRGRILDSRGRVMARTEETGGQKRRIYPYGETAGDITGYISRKYGRTGLEAAYNSELLGLTGSWGGTDFWSLQKLASDRQGNDVVLSIDMDLQQLAYRLLGNRKGAVVALEPATGKVLAMASNPGFNPQDIDSQWTKLKENPDSPLLNRASQGLYPPGSIMKVITAAGILTQKPETVNRVFEAPGFIKIEGRRIEDRQAVGRLSLAEALARSSNYVFTTLGMEQGAQVFVQTARNFGFARQIPFALPVETSQIPDPSSLSRLELAESAIGQGRVMATPLNMALVASAIANGGQIMAPTLVNEVRSPGGRTISTVQPKLLWTSITLGVANTIRDLMIHAVQSGTGALAAVPGVRVAGKTGSAQNPHGQTHAWFIGFAPAEKPKVAVAVIIENGGAGGAQAAPIAGEIMKKVIGQER